MIYILFAYFFTSSYRTGMSTFVTQTSFKTSKECEAAGNALKRTLNAQRTICIGATK